MEATGQPSISTAAVTLAPPFYATDGCSMSLWFHVFTTSLDPLENGKVDVMFSVGGVITNGAHVGGGAFFVPADGLHAVLNKNVWNQLTVRRVTSCDAISCCFRFLLCLSLLLFRPADGLAFGVK
jgi:hypothetical protein